MLKQLKRKLKLPKLSLMMKVYQLCHLTHRLLLAEAMALLLAASTVKALGWNSASFYSDCRTLVEAAEARNLLFKSGHWRIRPVLTDFFNATSSLSSFNVIHISRSQNPLAHALAKKAFLNRSSPTCSFSM